MPDIAVSVEVESIEENLVHGAFAVVIESQVRLGAVRHQQKCFLKVSLDECHALAGGGQQSFGILLFDQEFFLATLQVAGGDGFSQVAVDQTLPGSFQLGQPFLLGGEQCLAVGCSLINQRQKIGADLLSHVDWQLYGAPVFNDFALNSLDAQVRQITSSALLGPAEAEEVAVLRAALAGGFAVAETITTAVASKRTNKILVVLPGAITGNPA